jgi:hypothetical protein
MRSKRSATAFRSMRLLHEAVQGLKVLKFKSPPPGFDHFRKIATRYESAGQPRWSEQREIVVP